MKAIIVAGGKGTRLGSLTIHTPKPMINIGGKPILEHVIRQFHQNKIYQLIITVCYKSDSIKKYFGNGHKFNVDIEYLTEDISKPLGTAGNLFQLKGVIKDTFIVTYADILRDLDIIDMIKYHKSKRGIGCIQIYQNNSLYPKSEIILNRYNRIKYFRERPKKQNSNTIWSNASFYIIEPEVLNYIPPATYFDFGTNLFPVLLANNQKLYGYSTAGNIFDIGTVEKLEKVQKYYSRSLV